MLSFKNWFEEISDKTKALSEFGRTLDKNLRYQVNNYDKVTLIKPKMQVDSKPRSGGIWYGCGDSWIGYTYYNDYDYNYIHEIFINEPVICFIKNDNDYESFNEKYGTSRRNFLGGKEEQIDWSKVEKDYSGIDLCGHYDRTGWRYGWDVESGCIWHPNGFKGSKLIGYWDGNDYVSV